MLQQTIFPEMLHVKQKLIMFIFIRAMNVSGIHPIKKIIKRREEVYLNATKK
jgi:hypothetical protein